MENNPGEGGPPVVVTIAGSDSSGGAGIQADLKTFTALQCYGASVITALTAQNTTGVQSVHAPPPMFVVQQLRSVVEDINIRAFKTGMLYDAITTRVVASFLHEHIGQPPARPVDVVCDPVCVSTSGYTLLAPDALEVLVKELLPISTIVTPNKQEAEVLINIMRTLPTWRSTDPTGDEDAGRRIQSLEDTLKAALDLSENGRCSVLLKGGHLQTTVEDVERLLSLPSERTAAALRVEWNDVRGENQEILRLPSGEDLTDQPHEEVVIPIDIVVDALVEYPSRQATLYLRKRLDSKSTHGTGCTLSAGLACFLAQGHSLSESTRLAIEYTHQGIAQAFPLGHGHGPLNHMHAILPRVLPKPTAADPHPLTRYLISSSATIWKEYVQHEFVHELGKGTLKRECFVHFIKQDYHYLRYYARAYALLGAKSATYPAINDAAQAVLNILHETKLHATYCTEFGVSEDELEDERESSATRAYGSYLIDVGMRGDTSHLLLVLAACLLGYGEVGLWLIRESRRSGSLVILEGNPYLKWIQTYSGKRYQSAVRAGLQQLENLSLHDPPTSKRLSQWREIWEECTRLEKQFWDMAMTLAD